MKSALFLSACILLAICSVQTSASNEVHHRQHRQVHEPNYFYRPDFFPFKPRPVRQTPEYKYEFESYNDVHPANERQHKFMDQDNNEKVSRDGSHKCLDYCKKCGSSFGNTFVCAEDVKYHKPPYSFMLFSNKCQMKCYNKCHNTNYRYSTNALCQKVMSNLESDKSATKHPIRHERHHVRVNEQGAFDSRH